MTQTEFKDESTTVTLANGAVVEVADYHRVVKAFYKDFWMAESIAAASGMNLIVVNEIVEQEAANIDWVSRLTDITTQETATYIIHDRGTGLFFTGLDKLMCPTWTDRRLRALKMDCHGVKSSLLKIKRKDSVVVIDELEDEITPKMFLNKYRLGIL